MILLLVAVSAAGRGANTIRGGPGVQCPQCDAVLSNESNLNRHIRLKHSEEVREKEYECGLCKRRFWTEGDRKKHVRLVHENEGNKTCQVCGEVFGHAGAYIA